MRHLGSLVLSLVLTALWYVILGLGLSRYLTHDLRPTLTSKLLLGAALLVAGALYGLTLLPRLSPVGLVISGAALLVLGFWSLFASATNGPFEHLPKNLFGQPLALVLPTSYGIATFAAVPLLLTVASPRRWRRYANAQPGVTAYSATPPVPVPVNAPVGGYPAPGLYPPPTPGYGPPVDPFVTPVSPAGAGPEGTRVMPSAGGVTYSPPGSGAPSYQSSSPAAPNYPAPSSGAPSYPSPSSGAPNYSTPTSGAPNYSTPSSGAPSYSTPGTPGYPPSAPPASPPPANVPPANVPKPLWPSGPASGGTDDPDATRPI